MGVPLLEAAMVEVGLQEVDTYVSRHQNTVAQFIATNEILQFHQGIPLSLVTLLKCIRRFLLAEDNN